jgi:hypothetical protein
MLRLYLIGVRNLIIEVNARYIKGMLSNPDVAPRASINRWIVLILTFHFTLVHVAGTHHGPDRLSCHPLQDDDSTFNDKENFGDWIDQLHGFMHQINPIVTRMLLSTSIPTFALATDLSKGEDPSYNDVPQSENAIKGDEKLNRVRAWLENLVRPSDLSDSEYATFVCYYIKYFVDLGKLWRKDMHGMHKIVLSPEQCLDIIHSAHNDIGHKMIFTTKSLIALRFWWPNMKADIAWFICTCHLCQLRQT